MSEKESPSTGPKRLRTYIPREDEKDEKAEGRLTRTCIRCHQIIVIWRGEQAPPVPMDYTCFRCRE